MKKYRLKPRFYIIVATAGLLITGAAIVHTDTRCTEQIVKREIITPAYAAELQQDEESAAELVSLGEFTITHYCPCAVCCGSWAENRPTDKNGQAIVATASGARAEAGKTIAVDPDVIPYGTEVVINGHTYIAQDCGGAIQGNRIDVYCDSHQEAIELGKFTAEVYEEATK